MISNRMTGAEAMVRMLEAHDVEVVFGLCGDTTLPLYDALVRLDHGIRHVLTRDERHAAYMADGYARVSGRVGVCEGPSGGGATYILPGVVEANESSIPIVAITSDIGVAGRGRYTLTELDQESLFRPLTRFTQVIDTSANVPRAVRAAFAAASQNHPGAAHLGLPLDVQRDSLDADTIWGDAVNGRFPARRMAPDAADLGRLRDALLESRRPLFVCGGGVVISGAEAALEKIATALQSPVATTVSGQGSIAESAPLSLGVVGSNGGVPATRAVVEEADLVIFLGCRAGSVTTERWRYPEAGRQMIAHVDIDSRVIGANYATDVAVQGDLREALEVLAEELANTRRDDSPDWGRSRVAAAKREKFGPFHELASSMDKPIRPERVIAALQSVLPEDAIIVADPGTPCPYFSAYFEQRRSGRQFISNRAHGALGYALACSIGAQIGRPGSKVVAAMGDGSFGMAVGELETLARLNLPVTLVVFSNATYGWIKAGQKSSFGGRYFSVDFDRTDHAAVASAYGVKSWQVHEPGALQAAIEAAVAHDGPSLVDVISQPLQEARAPVSEWIA